MSALAGIRFKSTDKVSMTKQHMAIGLGIDTLKIQSRALEMVQKNTLSKKA
jgi:hypothetical protein